MAIHGFDHGSSMAIQPDTYGSPYVWLAGDWRRLDPENNTPPNSHTICRFKYSNGGGGPPKVPSDPARPSYLVCLDMNNTGASVKDIYQTHAGDTTLPGREPQGMAIWR